MYIIFFVLECTWHKFDKLVQDEGKQIGEPKKGTLTQCKQMCDEQNRYCKSFGYCPGDGCYLSYKAITDPDNEPKSSRNDGCFTNYKSCPGNNLKN